MFRNDHDAVSRMVGGKRIVIVGLSNDPSKPSYQVAKYLMEQGKEIIPVNPNHTEVLGKRCYRSLKEVPVAAGGVDVVDVFRRAEHCVQIIREAIEMKAKGVWLQSGIHCRQGKMLAENAGMDYVEDRCLMVEHCSRGQA